MTIRIIGLTADYIRHDSSVCLVEDGRVVFAGSEERFSGLKHDPRAPILCLTHILERFDLTLKDIDAFAVGMPAFRVMEGLLEAGPLNLGKALVPVLFANRKRFFSYFRERLSDSHSQRFGFDWLPKEKTTYISHYLSHGASAYRTSGCAEALSVNMDAAGSDEEGHPFSGSVFHGQNGEMALAETISRYASIGCFYNAVTQAAGFRPVGEDWKLMGLAAFGDPERCHAEMAPLAPRFEKGKWIITPYTVEAKLIDRPLFLKQTRLWKKLSSLVDRYGDRDVAAAAQRIAEEVLLDYFRHLLERYPGKNVVLAGGVFHNIKFCMRLAQQFPDLNIHVHPAAGDVGTAIGAALELYHRQTQEPTVYEMESMALGAEYGENELLAALVKEGEHVCWERPADLAAAVAALLIEKKVIGLFHGRAEWGPRALGQRSVIADPRDVTMRDHINTVLKDREWFMPFAPSIREEDGPRYLQGYFYSPFMTHAFAVTGAAKEDLFSAVHLDGTARPQIVRQSVLPHYHAILSAFKEKTGVGGVLNTSFNRHGLPMVNDPKDAVNHLLWGCVDALALGPFLVKRKGAPVPYKKRLPWSTDEIIKKWEPFDERLLRIRERRKNEGPGGDPA